MVCGLVARGSFRKWEGIKSPALALWIVENDPNLPPSIQLQSIAYMQFSNPVADAAEFRRDENTGPNYAPATSRASTAWWPEPTVDGQFDQRFQGDFPLSPEWLAMQDSAHQHHVNDNTAFGSIPENSMLSHLEIADDRTFCYPQDLLHSSPEDDNLNQAYVWSQFGQPAWYNPGQFLPSLQVMTPQPSTEPLPTTMPRQEQLTLHECAWIENDKWCGHLVSNNKRKLGTHLCDSHGIQGNDKKDVVCLWNGCNRKLQRGAIGRHIVSCHMETRWACENINCTKSYSRRDAMKKHAKDCQAA